MEASWDYVSRLAQRSEEISFDVTLVAELNLLFVFFCVLSVKCLVSVCVLCVSLRQAFSR